MTCDELVEVHNSGAKYWKTTIELLNPVPTLNHVILNQTINGCLEAELFPPFILDCGVLQCYVACRFWQKPQAKPSVLHGTGIPVGFAWV
jgi:hypothetical protein